MEKKRPGTVRIIGGQWRGRRLPVADLPGLRPSGDRGRETLFNWLQSVVRNARCVDLFAGSGALGLEAASRGAAEVILVEKAVQAAGVLRQNLAVLGASQCRVVETDAIDWLKTREPGTLDIVFIDPPFGSGLESAAMKELNERNLVSPGGMVYVETARNVSVLLPGSGWEISRQKAVGEVQLTLLKKV